MGRDGATGGPPSLDGLRSGGPARWLGRLPTWTSVLLLAGGTVAGIFITLAAGQEPGGLLGFFIIVGTIAAALCIRRGKVHLLFPAPALAFFVAAVVTGKVHDAGLGSSTASLGATFAQWVAGIFFPAVVATILVLLIGGGRWLLGRQLVSGQSPLAAGRPQPGKPRPAPRDRRPAVDSWAGDNPFDDAAPRGGQAGPSPRQGTGPSPRQGTGASPRQGTGGSPRQGTGPSPRQGTGASPRQGTGASPRQGTGASPRQGNAPRPGGAPRQDGGSRQGGAANGARPPRPSRDPRGNRDQWGGDPRLPGDRAQPPAGNPRPRPTGQPRAPRPSWNPNQDPGAQRPPRRQPPEGWTKR